MIVLHHSLFAQGNTIGLPFITNYPNAAYNGGAQNYAIVQDRQGVVYFANEKGLLEFDGNTWQCTPAGNKTKLRSLALDTVTGRFYTGAQGELGYFSHDARGFMRYTSLVNQLPPEYRNFSDVWSILRIPGGVVFQTSNTLFFYQDDVFTVFHEAINVFYDFIARAGDQILVNVGQRGLVRMQGQQMIPLPGGDILADQHIVSIFPTEQGKYLIATLKKGFYLLEAGVIRKWTTPSDAFLYQHWMNDAVQLSDGRLAIGTHDSGVLITDKNGFPLFNLNKINGLQNNTIIRLFEDRGGNLWAGLNNGIDLIASRSPFSRIYPDPVNVGTGFASILHEGKLYLAMNSGVYCREWPLKNPPLDQQGYRLLPDMRGQAWNFSEAAGTLFLHHHDGTFVINGERAVRISPTGGSWLVRSRQDHPDQLLCGTYLGVAAVSRRGNAWQQGGSIPGFTESSRVMEQDFNGDLWITHDYKGAYRLTLSPEGHEVIRSRYYHAADGFPSDLDVNVFRISNRLVFTSESGIFQYNPARDRFEHYAEYEAILGKNVRIRRLVPDRDGNIWFVENDAVGYLKRIQQGPATTFQRIMVPELNGMVVENFEHLYPLDSANIFIGAKQGFIHFNPTRYQATPDEFRVEIRAVRSLGGRDSLLFGRVAGLATDRPRFDSDRRAFRFTCAAPGQSPGAHLEYSYYLEGLEKNWSDWTNKPEKDYTNLPHGDFVFHVRARNAHSQISQAATFRFRIATPWYLTIWAQMAYLLVGLGLLAGLFGYMRRRHEREKRFMVLRQQRELRMLEQSYKLEAGQIEQELLHLRNERLQNEIAHKNQELAASAMHLVQKGSILATLKDALNEVAKATEESRVKQEVKRIIRNIEQDIALDNHWEQFAFHFDQVHNQFLRALQETYPELTAKDLKVCAYLRMGLSTKEVAALMNISVRGMEISRYRLRKKLGIPHEEGITEFLVTFNEKLT